MDLSIIIVNWNATESLKKCLDSAFVSIEGMEYEVIVADNNSDDIQPEMIKRDYPGVNFVFNDLNLGYAKANNQCAKIAEGDYLLFLNPDILLTGGAVKKMIEFLKKNEGSGAVGGKFLNPDGSLQRFYRRFPDLTYIIFYATFIAKLFPENRFAKRYQYYDEDFEAITRVDQPGTSFFMIRRSLFHELDGFDERMPIFFNDADLCRRIEKMGYDIYVLPDAIAYHLKGESIKKEKPEVIILEAALSLLEYFKKHKSLPYALFTKIIIMADQLIRFFYGLVLHLVGRQTGDKYLYRIKVLFYLMLNKRIKRYGC